MDDNGLVFEFLEGPARLRINLTGQLDRRAAHRLLDHISAAMLVDVRVLVVDVAAVERIDQDGMRALVDLDGLACAAGIGYEVVNAPPLLAHLLSLAWARFDREGPLHELPVAHAVG